MTHHPHVHMIVPGGGISLDGTRWIGGRSNYLLPVKVLSRLFRPLMLEMLVGAHDAGRLQFFGDHAHLADKAAFKAYLAPLHRTKWFVYSKRPFAGPEQVLAYLSRYTHRRRRTGAHTSARPNIIGKGGCRGSPLDGGRRVRPRPFASSTTAVQERLKDLQDAEQDARRWIAYRKAEAERDKLAMNSPASTRRSPRSSPDLMQRLAANDVQIECIINCPLPSGAKRLRVAELASRPRHFTRPAARLQRPHYARSR